MTVTLIATNNRYLGLSTDTKPVGVTVGSEFYEYNTKLTYITHDGTNWVRIK
jgi:hypothetical protein